MLANLKCSSCLCWKLWKLKSASWFHIIPGDDSLEYLLSAEGYEIILYTGRIANYLIRMSTTLANRPVLCDLLRVFGFDYFTCSQCLFTFTSISDVVPCFRGRLRIGFGARYFCGVFCFVLFFVLYTRSECSSKHALFTVCRVNPCKKTQKTNHSWKVLFCCGKKWLCRSV